LHDRRIKLLSQRIRVSRRHRLGICLHVRVSLERVVLRKPKRDILVHARHHLALSIAEGVSIPSVLGRLLPKLSLCRRNVLVHSSRVIVRSERIIAESLDPRLAGLVVPSLALICRVDNGAFHGRIDASARRPVIGPPSARRCHLGLDLAPLGL